MTVRGIGFVPQGSHNDYDAGAWATADGFEALFGADFKYHLALVALRPGADPQAVLDRLTKDMAGIGGGDRISVEAMQPPEQLAEVQDVQILPLFLGGFLALLAVGAVGHALATAVRRRRHEVAVMRALGMTRAQSRLVVFTQASLLAVAGLAFGVPLGVALGRTLWRVVAERTPLFYEPPVALWALLAIGPAAVLIANLLALWPGRHAARLRIGHILRTE
jgi:ABC-type antimicrobial peptide transport system permease subunit